MILHIGERIYRWFLILLCSVMFVVVGFNVFSRYVLNSSLGWADELARFVFIWVSFLGAVVAYQKNEHVGLDFFVNRIGSQKVRLLLRLIGEVLVLLVLGCLVYYGWIVAMSANNVSPALYIPMWIVYLVVPLTGSLMVLINLWKLKTHLRNFLRSN
jgi:TRAP-type C4-dicarboxylate transport system permease small subunit